MDVEKLFFLYKSDLMGHIYNYHGIFALFNNIQQLLIFSRFIFTKLKTWVKQRAVRGLFTSNTANPKGRSR